MAFLVFLYALLGSGSRADIGSKDVCDLIELNHKFADGKHVFDQVILWHRRPESGKYEVRAWFVVEDRESLNRRPRKTAGNMWETTICLEGGKVKTITSALYRETWTDIDPEQQNLKIVPGSERYQLSKQIQEKDK